MLNHAEVRCQWIVALAQFHCSVWDEDVQYHLGAG